MKTPMWVAFAALGLVACSPAADQNPPGNGAAENGPVAVPTLTEADLASLAPTDTVPGFPAWTRADWDILHRTVTWVRQNGVDTLTVGGRIARIGIGLSRTPITPAAHVTDIHADVGSPAICAGAAARPSGFVGRAPARP